ncbi:contractile injection system tape measure protein [Caballeronia sp. LZ065]|uniref:contractile injection system tape measure protein n=1 Tax=Caballeronia sp. LZ065 TaxID=3038571 RepID=UPI00286436F6|nr:contractile injection system tape measure protein [Caballeronia sp. LZ065]MDR5782031.1 contractile injection system tape measure protein [Caballeronia sp. LZ065]
MRTTLQSVSLIVDTRHDIHATVTDHCARLFRGPLKEDISSLITEVFHREGYIRIAALHLDIGTLRYDEIDAVMPKRLLGALRQALAEHVVAERTCEVESMEYKETHIHPVDISAPEGEQASPSATVPGDIDSPSTTVPGNTDLRQIDTSPQERAMRSHSAIRALLERHLASLNQDEPPERILAWLAPACLHRESRQFLLERARTMPEAAHALKALLGETEATEIALCLKALIWLRNHPSSTHSSEIPELPDIPELKGALLSDTLAFMEKSPHPEIRRWQARLWRHETVRTGLRKRLTQAETRRLERLARAYPERRIAPRRENESVEAASAVYVPGAGLIVLWPLLPDLFRSLHVWDGEQFVTAEAQEQAAAWLDWLVWQDVDNAARTHSFARRLCGLSSLTVEDDDDPPATSEEQAKTLLENWLLQLPMKLPGWRSLQPEDIRALFLQRPGDLSMQGPVPVLNLEPQPFDILLRDLPWPLSTVVLPWLPTPIEVNWPIPNLDPRMF